MTTVWGLSLRRCGALLRMNRSIQAEGVFGIIKWDRSYKRLFRRASRLAFQQGRLASFMGFFYSSVFYDSGVKEI